jgi:hypothetical protein
LYQETLIQALGPYRIEQYLGSLNGSPHYDPFVSKGSVVEKSTYTIELGIQEIISLREILDVVKEFQVAPGIKLELNHGIEYYRVSLVVDFSHQEDELRFTRALIEAEMVPSEIPYTIKPLVYSIAPQTVEEKIKMSKEFAINPQLQLTDISISGAAYTHKKEYIKLHPKIVGHYSAGQNVWWEFNTTDGIDDIKGTQLVEFIVKQSSGTRSVWRARPEATLKHKKRKITEWLVGYSSLDLEDFKSFNIPS